jgi:DUF1009 family protein
LFAVGNEIRWGEKRFVVGNNRFPFLVVEEIKRRDGRVICIALKEEAYGPGWKKCVIKRIGFLYGNFRKS